MDDHLAVAGAVFHGCCGVRGWGLGQHVQDETAACLGIHITYYKVVAFTISHDGGLLAACTLT
jgi:hypothetical protein